MLDIIVVIAFQILLNSLFVKTLSGFHSHFYQCFACDANKLNFGLMFSIILVVEYLKVSNCPIIPLLAFLENLFS